MAIAITLPDGSIRQFEQAVTGLDVAQSIGPGLAKASVAMRVNGELQDLTRTLADDARLEFITRNSEEALEILRHDAAHVMAQAVKELYPDTQVTIGRAPDSTLVIDDDYASSRHARIYPAEGTWIVEDLGSTNGTWIDRTRITTPTVLPVGAPLRVGRTTLQVQK